MKTGRLAVLTSGGDAPGMNAALRAVVRVGLGRGFEVLGVGDGYAGLIAGHLQPLASRDVAGIAHSGGTVLGTRRCPEFATERGRRRALEVLDAQGVSGVVVIGGDGSQSGAYALAQEGLPIVGVAATIDNDLLGSEITIGVDTALNVALEAIDRLKVTASSHQRAFLVEVMGRECGYLALMAGIASGAEAVLIPEVDTSPEQLADQIRAAYDRGKAHALAVVAEGANHRADALAAHFREHQRELGFDLRVTSLGHVQRGGAPTAFDRVLAARLGAEAVERLSRGKHGVLVGLVKDEVAATPLSEVAGRRKQLDLRLLELARVLAT